MSFANLPMSVPDQPGDIFFAAIGAAGIARGC
jgi:hypothetical protein